MPKIKDTHVVFRTSADERIDEKFTTSVSADGDFKIRLPAGFKALGFSAVFHSLPDREGVSYWSDHHGEYLRGNCLDVVRKALVESLEVIYTPTTKTDTIIAYMYKANVHYAIGSDGNIYVDGNHATDALGEGNYEWGGSEKDYHSLGNKPFSIGIAVGVFERTITSRGDNEKFEYNRYYSGESHFSTDTYGDKINNMANMPHIGDNDRDEWHEIPYTEERAKVFYDLVTGLCRAHERLSSILDKPEAFMEMLEQNKQLKLLS